MTGQICGRESCISEKLYCRSRGVRRGEVIDFFLSHSWHDDAAAKWLALERTVSDFASRKNRYPTFWLDKVCINQNQIADGLRALPVNVMACTKVLVLCSDTYPNRLWCIWELFTLIAFASEEQAFERMLFVPFGVNGTASRVLHQLACFDVGNARCYNPNEEGRLKSVIAASGTEAFNATIRNIASHIPHHLPLQAEGDIVATTSRVKDTSVHAEMIGAKDSRRLDTLAQFEDDAVECQEIFPGDDIDGETADAVEHRESFPTSMRSTGVDVDRESHCVSAISFGLCCTANYGYS